MYVEYCTLTTLFGFGVQEATIPQDPAFTPYQQDDTSVLKQSSSDVEGHPGPMNSCSAWSPVAAAVPRLRNDPLSDGSAAREP